MGEGAREWANGRVGGGVDGVDAVDGVDGADGVELVGGVLGLGVGFWCGWLG
jgi:hypothetical protein